MLSSSAGIQEETWLPDLLIIGHDRFIIQQAKFREGIDFICGAVDY